MDLGRGGLRLKVRLVAGRTCFVALPAHLTDDLLDSHADALQAGAIAISWLGAPPDSPHGDDAERGAAMVRLTPAPASPRSSYSCFWPAIAPAASLMAAASGAVLKTRAC